MRIKPLMGLLLFVLIGLSAFAAGNQSAPLKAKVEIDGKETKDKFRILLYADGVASEPTIGDDGSFYLPQLTIPKVDVRLISGKYDLLYKDVYLTKFHGTLVFGVTEHLQRSRSQCKGRQKLVSSYSLRFEPVDGDGTEMTVTTCK